MRYEIKIPKPCSEKWSQMTPTEKGAFCSSCKKEVYDFTNISNYNLAKFLDSEKKMCGKFKPNRLNIEISSLNNTRYTRAGLFLGISTLLSLSTPAFSQKKSFEILKVEQSKLIEKSSIITEKVTDSIQFRGNIFDENGGLPGANIRFKSHSYGVQTDFDGNFSINIDKKKEIKNLILIVSYLGFETQEIKLNENTEFIKVKMIEDEVFLGEVVIIKKQNIFRRIGNLFRKKEKINCH
tara:strand:+ start:67 stop:780 length:714 start_codon:yes stop_codon:yes gene_type:complete